MDAGDAVRAELREHEQMLLEEEEAKREETDKTKLQVMKRSSLSLSLSSVVKEEFSPAYSSVQVTRSHVLRQPNSGFTQIPKCLVTRVDQNARNKSQAKPNKEYNASRATEAMN